MLAIGGGEVVQVSAAIMAHPSRRKFIPSIQARLGRYVPVVWDEIGDRWDTGRRSLLAYDPKATHHLVIQDDAIPAPDLMRGLELWLPRLPESVLCLYSGNIGSFRVIHRRAARPPCFLNMRQLQWGVAIVIPTKFIPAIVEMGDAMPEIGNYDMRIGMWCVENGVPVLYPQQCWVEHRTTPSLVPGRSARRRALSPWQHSMTRWGRQMKKPLIIDCPEFSRNPGGREHYPDLKGSAI